MPYPQFNRFLLALQPLARRRSKKEVGRDFIAPDTPPPALRPAAETVLTECVARIVAARQHRRPVMMAFGAHTIKNGLAPVLMRLLEDGWFTLLASNGAGIIHDWEFAFQGKSTEDVRAYVARGEFGNWQETGFYINLALNVGAYEGKGYGESLGALIHQETLTLPDPVALEREARDTLTTAPERAAAAIDLWRAMRAFELKPGVLSVPHPWKMYSVQAAAYRLGIPFTGHPMFGHDIIYNHPMNDGASLGRTAQRDFLTFAESVSRLQDGVYLSVGSAVMSPMVFEKAMSMAQNLAVQQGAPITGHYLCVVDLTPSTWDWTQGEPPETDPAYYLRFNKSFHRMGGTMRYLCADNRDFLLALYHRLKRG